MKNKIIAVVVATKEATDELKSNFKNQYDNVDIIIVENRDAESMAAKYNLGLSKALEKSQEGWIIFQHDDARILQTKERVEAILAEISDNVTLVGVAGNQKIPPLSPGFWWFGLGQPGFAGSGRVEHVIPHADVNYPGKKISTAYGPYPLQVAAVDGVWIAVRAEDIVKHDLKFDEKNFDGYHYYDADFSATVRSKGLKIYTCEVMVSHDSGGESMRQASFVISQQKFIKKWMRRQKEYNAF